MDTHRLARTDTDLSNIIPIASLDPNLTPTSNGYIDAIVTLVWPYSSSTRATSLLLADPDFRLRSQKGQVRVNFSHASAHHVATSGVGIGDRVRLRLAGSVWDSMRTITSTPGRSVEGELVFKNKLELHVN